MKRRTTSRERPASKAIAPSKPIVVPPGAVLALILLGATMLHWTALRLSFFADDFLFLQQVRGRSPLSVLALPDAIGNFFRPVGRQLYFWTLGTLSGESPLAFHVANLILFLGLIALLFLIVRRMAGTVAAAVASSFVALHYAADVPLRWVSGSQDLLAVCGALGAIVLHLSGRRWWAAPVLLLALLSKETVILTPLIAAALDRRAEEPWRAALRRAWPLAAAVAAWAALYIATLPQRSGFGASLAIEPLGIVAVLVHLVHVTLGLEWRGAFTAVGSFAPAWIPLVLVVAAVILAGGWRGRSAELRAALIAGVIWALAATAPLIAVAATWSAYYYLFALCGVGLVLGALVARAPRALAAVVVIALVLGSQSGRQSMEFTTGRGAWTWQSRINRAYVDRATTRIARYLEDLKRQRPTVPPRTTFLFGGIPAFLAWQSADGPLVRWAYRDTSLRSYYQSDFKLEYARRGPVFFFIVDQDSLKEEAKDPRQLRGIALRLMLDDRYDVALDVLTWLSELEPRSLDVKYFRAWIGWAMGDSVSAYRLIQEVGLPPVRGLSPEAEAAERQLAVGDTIGAMVRLAKAIERFPFDPRLHALSADVRLGHEPRDPQGRIEALAARVLADDGPTWLRWGIIQAGDARHRQAVRSLERAMALGIHDPAREEQVRAAIAQLKRALPGGDLAQQEIRRAPGAAVTAP
ncbi:MAG TPA: hypothetical protein VJY35_05330 [Candidatus Eisenbacteria bacterium]|nr:hypothetical protein [Candidatus Eisenbacteria bacterium]